SQTLVKQGEVKQGQCPRVVHCCRKKCLLLNDGVLIAATLLTGFSRRAKAFEMVLAGRLLEGIAAGRTPHYSLCM
ncbi:GTR11 protein, partial [Polioptila caerulea]|nr:GTR11 protein [Polioptila caerulea]